MHKHAVMHCGLKWTGKHAYCITVASNKKNNILSSQFLNAGKTILMFYDICTFYQGLLEKDSEGLGFTPHVGFKMEPLNVNKELCDEYELFKIVENM